MGDIWLSTGWDLHMGAQGYVQQLGGSYLSVDLVSRKCYHFITVEQLRPSGSQGLEGVCGMQPDTIGGKGWLCCPEKGWKATFFISPAQEGKVRSWGGGAFPLGVEKRVWKSHSCPSLQAWSNGREVTWPLEHGKGQANIPTGTPELEGRCQNCEEERRDSWASGCPPHPLALSVAILFLRNKSQKTHALFVEEQETAGCCVPCPQPLFKYIPMKWHIAGSLLLGQTGLAPAPWEAWRGEGQCKSHRASYPSLGKAQPGLSGSHSLPATWAPTMFLKSGVNADN